MNINIKIIIFILFIANSYAQQYEFDVVPDSITAIKIAVAVWTPIYGEQMIKKEQPLVAQLFDDRYWIVKGTLPKPTLEELKEMEEEDLVYAGTGGTLYIEISKRSGKILDVYHSE